VGPNGAGKSTLIKILLGRETPTEGMARLGSSVTVGYFAQDTGDLDLDATVLDNMMDVAEMTPEQARTHLGKFLFTGDDAFRETRLLSGGEKNKLVLAQLTYLKPNLLILDEPTNHLDLDSRQALGEMLIGYEGTLLLISHDRYLLNQVSTHTLEIAGGRATLFEGAYDKFRLWREKNPPKPEAFNNTERNGGHSGNPALDSLLAQRPEPPPAVAGLNAHQMSKERQRARNQVTIAENKVASLESRLQAIETALSSPSPSDNIVALSQEHGGIQSALSEAIEVWERDAAYADSLA
jgi:ATP-binding cassette subfamily F protein 3